MFTQAIYILFDPRGRVNRKGLLVLASALFVLQIAFFVAFQADAFPDSVAAVLKIAFLWIAIVAAAKRLHDTGRTAWWIPGATLILIVWTVIVTTAILFTMGPRAVEQGSEGFTLAMVLTMVPIVIYSLWLHFAPGDAGQNTYGAHPDGLGFSHPSDQPVAAAA